MAQIGELVREELRLATGEMLDNARRAGAGDAFVAAAITVCYARGNGIEWTGPAVGQPLLAWPGWKLPLLPERAAADTARRTREAGHRSPGGA